MAEKLITLAKQDNVHRRRLARRLLMPRTGLILAPRKGSYREAPATGDAARPTAGGRSASNVENSVNHLFEHVGPQFVDRPGGYARIIPMMPRKGDGVMQVQLQLVDYRAPEPGK